MSAMPADQAVELGEVDYECWDGEIVVRGQPSRWHEAVRAELMYQLMGQLPEHLRVVTSSAVGDDQTSAHSDGSVMARDPSGVTTVAWVEVISESDLRRGDKRLVGRRRRDFLFEEGVLAIWVVEETLGGISLKLLSPDGPTEVYVAPATVTVTLAHGPDHHPVTLDLGRLQEAGELMDEA